MLLKTNIVLGLLFFTLFLGGCAGSTPPVQDLKTAKMALVNAQEAAESAEAKSYYESAEKYLKEAQKMMQEKSYDEARYLAQKATADARVAKIKATNALLQKKVDALDLELKKLKQDFVTIDDEKKGE